MEKVELSKISTKKLIELKKRLIKIRNESGRWWFWFHVYFRVLEELDKRYKKPTQSNLFKGKVNDPF
ncbi:hypothetical protein ES695_20295 [Candidatus Atribacteria bacterium 1244-E10-H5-B2]|nr:MAG: hypothetical protein ES695_20295 [Candidatus Atribacteria bacterium 1244-E10-H5-B2]